MKILKRAGAWLLAAVLAAGTLPSAGAAAVPKPQTKTVQVTADNIYSSLGDVSVEVTYTGWLGEIASIPRDGAGDWLGGPAGNTDKIAVLKEGSEIRFTIKAGNPKAYYNFCYDGIRTENSGMEYGWDDCGGGTLHFYNENGLQSYPIQVYGKADGSTGFKSGDIFKELQPFGRKLGSGQYAYTAYNGLLTYAFSAKPARDESNEFYPNDYAARYVLGTALTVSDAQIKEMQETGTMTFLKGTEYEYQNAYPGVAELFGLPPTKTNPDFRIYEQGQKEPHGYIATNNTGKQLTAYYALLSYWPKTTYYPATEISPYESEYFRGQLLALDLDLAPGESLKGECWCVAVGWSTMKHCWIQFDNDAERDAFFQNNALRLAQGASSTGNNTYEIDTGAAGIRWMKDVLGISIQSGKK